MQLFLGSKNRNAIEKCLIAIHHTHSNWLNSSTYALRLWWKRLDNFQNILPSFRRLFYFPMYLSCNEPRATFNFHLFGIHELLVCVCVLVWASMKTFRWKQFIEIQSICDTLFRKWNAIKSRECNFNYETNLRNALLQSFWWEFIWSDSKHFDFLLSM